VCCTYDFEGAAFAGSIRALAAFDNLSTPPLRFRALDGADINKHGEIRR
jgi:hypothetical protein